MGDIAMSDMVTKVAKEMTEALKQCCDKDVETDKRSEQFEQLIAEKAM